MLDESAERNKSEKPTSKYEWCTEKGEKGIENGGGLCIWEAIHKYHNREIIFW